MAHLQGGDSSVQSEAKYDKWVEENEQRAGNVEVEQGGMKFVVHPTVFLPNISFRFMELADRLYPKGGSMLDVGSGCGVIGIHAAVCGVSRVLATDIVEAAAGNIQENAVHHEVSEIVEGRVSDIFSAVRQDERFDVIFWNYPFIPDMTERDFSELSDIERGIRDPGQGCLRRYCIEARQFVNPGGKVFVTYSPTMGDWPAFCKIMEETGWEADVFAEWGAVGFQVKLYELKDNSAALQSH